MNESELAIAKAQFRHLVITNFSEFVQHFWSVNDPGSPLVWSWPLQVMCDHIQAWDEGHLKNNLAVMVPPGSAKSTLLSIMYPAWVWASKPTESFLYVSGSKQVVERDSGKCMALIQSEEYRDLIQPAWELDKNQMAKELFKNTMKGFRIAIPAGARIIGLRVSKIICVSGGTILETNRGQMRMDEVVRLKDPEILVQGIDEKTGEIEFHKVSEWQSNGVRRVVTIKSDTMKPLIASTNHPVYVIGKGWTKACEITSGMEIVSNGLHMRTMREDFLQMPGSCGTNKTSILQPAVRGEVADWRSKSNVEGCENKLQMQGMQCGIPDMEKQRDGMLQQEVCWEHSMGQNRTDTKDRSSMPNLSKVGHIIGNQPEAILQQEMRECGTLAKDVGGKQFQLPGGCCDRTLSGRYGDTNYSFYGEGAGWEFMRDLPIFGQNSCSPFERKEEGQSYGEYGLPVSKMPQSGSQEECSRSGWNQQRGLYRHVVENVEHEGEESVFNLKIAGESRNYFADGILTHNCDDPNDAAAGKADMEAVSNWWFTAACNRVTSLITGKRCVIQQRLSEIDLIGCIMEREAKEWEQLILRMEHEPDDVPARTNLRAPEHPGGWTDPRKAYGELLFPERAPRHVIEAEKVRMGSFAYASQNQQKPMARGGNLFKADWFRHFEISNGEICCDGKRFKMSDCTIFGCADTAFSIKRSADFSVIATCLVTPERHLAILDVYRKRMEAPDVKKELETHHARGIWKYFCIEEKASGIEILQDFVRRGMVVKGLKAEVDKVERSRTAQIFAEQGRIWLPKDAIWLSAWMDEITRFPKGKHDDQCLIGDTEIQMGDGTKKKIDSIIAGEFVMTRQGPRKVLWSGVTCQEADVMQCGPLVCTASHPIWDENSKSFKSANDYDVGCDFLWYVNTSEKNSWPHSKRQDFVAQTAGKEVGKSIPPVTKKCRVFNLKVEGEPEFFANGVLVHNCDGSLSYPAIEVASCSVFNSENSLPAGGWGMKRIF